MKNNTLSRAEAQRAALIEKCAAVNAQNASFMDACEVVRSLFSPFVGKKVANTSNSATSRWVKRTQIGEALETLYFNRLEAGPLQTVSVRVFSTGRTLYLEHKVSFEVQGRNQTRTLDWCLGTCNTDTWVNEPADGVLQELHELPKPLRTDWNADEVINLRLELDYAEDKVTAARAALAEFCR